MTLASVWALVKSVRNQRFIIISRRTSFQPRTSSKKILEVLGQHPLFEVVFAFYNGTPERVKEVEQQLEELIASEQNLNLVQSPAQLEGLGENQIIDKEFVQDAPDYRFVVKNFFK